MKGYVADELEPVDEVQGNDFSALTYTPPGGPIKVVTPDQQKEEELYRRWMGRAADFRHEERCDFSDVDAVLNAAPKEPHFGYDNPRTQQSMAVIKRYLSTNLKAYPVCRHSGETVTLVFHDRRHHDGDGSYLVPSFTCKCFGGR